MIEATLFILSVSCFIVSFRLGNISNRLNKIEEKLNKHVCTASYEILNPDDKKVIHIHVGNLSIEEVDKFVDDVVTQMKKEQKHG